MQSASVSFPLRLVRRTRDELPGGVVWSAGLLFLLTLAIAKSTVTAQWVPGIEVVTMVALVGAVFMGLLAVLPIPWGVGVGIGMVAGPFVAGFASWPALHGSHPADPLGLGLLSAWWGRILDGSAIADSSFDLYLIGWLMWVTGGWLAWCVLRWRRPLLGLVPGAAAFATNLLNFPRDQNGYVLAVLVLTLALLLWTNYTSSIANATRARVKLTGDARWDFWESGLVAMAALIVLAIMLPPISTVDRTVDMESSAFTSWAQLLETLSHPGSFGAAGTTGGTTGFSPDVLLNTSLKRTHNPVFMYTVQGDFVGPHYFRGVNETLLFHGAWRYQETGGLKQAIQTGEQAPFGEDYSKLGVALFNIRMIAPPGGNADILFYPGRLFHVNRDTVATEVLVPPPIGGPIVNIDRLSTVNPRTSRGTYAATVEYSTATDGDLQAAGTAYPDWARSYMSLPSNGYRDPAVLERIHQLALQVVQAAGATNPYDAAVAIETYLRSDRFTYTLTPPKAPDGEDPLAYFLFNSRRGYCEFFATAMGDMLRSLGIPSRLVSGFGPGTLDTTTNSFVVRSEDAHTWVEVYFPKYGWIEFEPTNDHFYEPIPRGVSGLSNICYRDNLCNDPTGGSGVAAVGTPSAKPVNEPNGPSSTSGGGGFSIRIPDPSTLTKIVGVVLAFLFVLFAALARYLRPRSVMGVWRRTLVLTRLAGADQRSGETPYELGRRLALSFPEATEPIRSLASGFVVAAYAPPDEARTARTSVMEAWSGLRPLLLRRVFARFRPI
ncbi:MAG: transglutaminase domain-containing protein [Chloroflexi bacterium]|nr:MAG: transglutaminase domain-containing protein [Chloroflexota bacterium]